MAKATEKSTSRRAVLTALAATPLAVGATTAAAAPDPIFSAIEAHRAAHARLAAFFANNPDADDPPDDLEAASTDRLAELVAMTPTTPAGCVAMLRHIETYIREGDAGEVGQLFTGWYEPLSKPGSTLLGRLAAVIEQSGPTGAFK